MTFSDRILRFKNYNNKNEIDMCQKQTQIDWEQRRYEIAKDIFTAWCSNPDKSNTTYRLSGSSGIC